MKVSTYSENVIEQLSIRIDEHSDEILRLRERSHDMETTIPVMNVAIEKNHEHLMKIFEGQSKLDEKIMLKLERIEKLYDGLMLAKKHWKLLFVLGIFFAVLGFTFEKGMKDFIVALAPDSVVKVAKVIANG